MSTASVELPENAPNDYDDYHWPVPLTGNPRWPGQVTIRRSDTRISVANMGYTLDSSDDARALAAALLAAAEQLDAGVSFTDLAEKFRSAVAE